MTTCNGCSMWSLALLHLGIFTTLFEPINPLLTCSLAKLFSEKILEVENCSFNRCQRRKEVCKGIERLSG